MTTSGSASINSAGSLASADSVEGVASAASVVSAGSAASVKASGAAARVGSERIGLAAVGGRFVEVDSGEGLNGLSTVSPKKAATLVISTSLQVVRRERSSVDSLGFSGAGRDFVAGSTAGWVRVFDEERGEDERVLLR